MESLKNYFKTIGKGFFNKLFERSIRVYIQNHLGEFLVGKLSTDQVDVGLDGGSFASLYLNAEAINERLDVVNVPFVLVDGYVDVLHLRIPWADISTESIVVEVDGLMLTLKLKEEEIDDGMDVKSMLESMTASMVEEMMKADIAAADIQKISEVGKEASPFESIELMSEFIQSITSRIQVSLTNVIIKTEKSPGVCMELKIDSLEYYDKDCATKKATKQVNNKATPAGFSNKVLEISKVTLNLEEIWDRSDSPAPLDPIQQSSVAFDIAMSSPPTSGNYMQQSCMAQSIYPGMSSVDIMEQSGSQTRQTGGLIPIISMEKTQTVNIQIKNDDMLPGPAVDVSWTVESVHVLLSPNVLRLLSQLLNSDSKEGERAKNAPRQTPMTHEDFELCRRVALEEERQGKFSNGKNIDVPPLTIERHLEMMHGASAGSLLMDEDMFFSANPPGFRRDSESAVDMSDSASVSTFGVNSTFSTTNASAFSHTRKLRENASGSSSKQRGWDDDAARTQNVNITLPFLSLTVLLEDPEMGAALPEQQQPSSFSASCTPHKPSQPLSSSYPPKAPTSIRMEELQPRPSSAPKSFSSVDPLPDVHENCEPSSFMSFQTCKNGDEEEDEEEDVFHDSGDYFEPRTPVHQSKKDPFTENSFSHKPSSSLSPPKPINTSHKTASCKQSSSSSSGAEGTNSVQRVAVAFFQALAKLDFRKPLHKIRDEIASILPFDHLGVLAKPVHLELMQESRHAETKNKLKVACGKFEVIECLFDCFSGTSDFANVTLPKLPQYSMLLTFDVNNVSEIPAQFDPYSVFNVERPKLPHSALTLTLEAVQSKRRHRDSPAMKLSLDFGKLTSEVDITILDRLTHLINVDWGGSGTGCAGPGGAAGSAHLLVDNFGHIDEAIKDEQSSQKLNLDLQVKMQHATLRVRFPVLDLRIDRPPQGHDWWRRNLHKEVLLLEAEAPEATCLLVPDSPWQLAVQVFKIEAYLQEDINTDPVLFGEVTVDDAKATPYDGPHFNWPRLVISVSKKSDSALETGEESDTSATSIDSVLEPGLLKKEPGPFSSKKSMFTHDDLSFTERSSTPINDEMVSPGDAAELRQFRDDCLARTSLAIDITVPSVTAFMPSRDFLELLYNRFNNDLLMWEPQPPRSRVYTNSMAPSSTSLGVMHMLQHQQGDVLVTSTDSYLSDSEDDESMHYSIHDRHCTNKLKSNSSVKLLNKMCFTLSISNGKLLAIVPHCDPEVKAGDVHGEIMLTLKDGLLFSVNQYGGDPDLRYLCLQANNAHMYHNSCVMLPVQPGNMDPIRGEKIPLHLRSRIYRSDPGASSRMQSRAGWGPDTPDMLTLVVKTKMDTLDNVKNFTIALRVDGATLRHEMHNPGESWISQVIDLVDLKDFPILGYTLPKIMTEIHVHIENCCVDYRPIHLPVWAFLTIEHLSVCSNIIAESAFSQIRLSLDDTAMFLTQKHSREVHLIDYICVAEMDHFNIWLQFCYDKSGKQKIPKSDLRFMVHELRLLTCADSARALMDLIQYLVRDGDLEESTRDDEGDLTPTPMEEAMQAMTDEEFPERQIPSPVVPVPTITPEQEASVVSALKDAMSDCAEPCVNIPGKGTKDSGTRVFFQPGSNLRHSSNLVNELEGAMQINISDGSDSGSPDEMDLAGEEFEIVDASFKEITNIKGSHEVTMLSDSPVELHETFLAKPTSSYDHLRAPDKFPDPEYQYTLKEMSLIWHIFGGSDFKRGHRGSSTERLSRTVKSPRNQRRMSETGPVSVIAGHPSRNSWRRRGGEYRDLDVLMELDLNKIRFRYEVYPSVTKQASRFKLLVNNIEMRDKVSASDINKFLVKLVDKEHPMQSSAYMLMFSGTFTRPDYLPFRQECEVKVFCLPIKLNVDQVSLNFLRKFVSELADPETEAVGSGGRSSSPLGGRLSPSDGGRSSPRHSVSSTDQPIMRVGEPSTKESSMDETELLIKFEDFSNQQSLYLQKKLTEMSETELPEDDLPVFIKSFVLISDITIKLDYRGKRCDMDSGVMGMMLGVASLTGSIVKLKRINCQKGILGWDKLLMYVANEWLNDIRTNQIHSILKGVGSLSIFCQIVQGLTDLVRLPIEQYQKDRRIIRGLQRGANSFTLNTVMAILELTNKVVGSIQYCAELGYDMMSPGPSVRRRKMLRHRHRQPRTTAEGAKAALQLVTEGVKESASNLSAIVSEESAHKGYVGVVGGTLRNATPECLFKPLALLAEAGTHIVQGARNEVDPCVMHEEEDRWKHK